MATAIVSHVAFILITLYCQACNSEKLTPLLSGDAYNIVGDIEIRSLGRCNFSYAWLAIPTGSHQDIYAHAAACSRLELRFLNSASSFSFSPVRDVRSPQISSTSFVSSIDDELSRVNRDYAGQLVDLQTLDALLQGSRIDNGMHTSSPPLALDDRLFYLSDRLGQYKMLAMLRPGRLPKIEIIPPPSEKAHFYPRYVLCYRKACLEPKQSIQKASAPSDMNENSPNYVAKVDNLARENKRLYNQVIVYRVVFAIAAFLCLIVSIAAIILCFRLKKYTRQPRKGDKSEFFQPYHNAALTPSMYHVNGKMSFSHNSPAGFVAPSNHSFSIAHGASDTASLHNTALSSNHSACELLSSNGNSGAFRGGYALQDSSGMVQLIPITWTQTNQGGKNMRHAFQPFSVSPSSSARFDSRPTEGYRTGSLDRRSDTNSETLSRRRTPIQVVPLPQAMDMNGFNFTVRPTPCIPQLFKPVSAGHDQPNTPQANAGTVIHRYPDENSFTFCNTPQESLNGEHA